MVHGLNPSFLSSNTYFLSCWKFLNPSKCSLTVSLFVKRKTCCDKKKKNPMSGTVLAQCHTHSAFLPCKNCFKRGLMFVPTSHSRQWRFCLSRLYDVPKVTKLLCSRRGRLYTRSLLPTRTLNVLLFSDLLNTEESKRIYQ